MNWRDKGGVDGSVGRGLVQCMLELTNWWLKWWMLRWITVLLGGWMVCKMIRWVDGWMIKRKCRWMGDKTGGGWIVLDLFLDSLMNRWWNHSNMDGNVDYGRVVGCMDGWGREGGKDDGWMDGIWRWCEILTINFGQMVDGWDDEWMDAWWMDDGWMDG